MAPPKIKIEEPGSLPVADDTAVVAAVPPATEAAAPPVADPAGGAEADLDAAAEAALDKAEAIQAMPIVTPPDPSMPHWWEVDTTKIKGNVLTHEGWVMSAAFVERAKN